MRALLLAALLLAAPSVRAASTPTAGTAGEPFAFLAGPAPAAWAELRGLWPQILRAERKRPEILDSLKRERARVAPRVARVEAAKESGAQEHWWERWWLDRELRALQGDLVVLRGDEEEEQANKQALFSFYSAVDEVFSSLASRKLREFPSLAGGRKARERAFLRTLFEQKKEWSARMAALGFSDENPYPLARVPGIADRAGSALQRQDRLRARKARAIQLEAWGEQVDRERSLLEGFVRAGALDFASEAPRLAQLKALSARIGALARENQEALRRAEPSNF